MAGQLYDIGDQIALTGTFTNASGALADPTTAAVKIKIPSGTEASYSPTKTSTGIYAHAVTTTESGRYYYRFVGTGAVIAAAESFFDVRPSAFTAP